MAWGSLLRNLNGALMQQKNTRIIALLAAGIALLAWILYQSNVLPIGNEVKLASKEATLASTSAPPAGKSAALPVTAMIVQTAPLRDLITVNGATAPAEEVAVTSEVAGKIEQILFQEGQAVKQGQPLVQLDNSTLKAERQRLVVEQKLAAKIAERLKGLYEKEGVSLQEYEVAAAEVDKLEADIALVDVQLEKTSIPAPFSGILGLKELSEGSYLSPGDPIIDLVKINPIRIRFSVPEKFSQNINKGRRVDFTVEGIEGMQQAKVIARAAAIDPETRTLEILAEASNPGGKILPGAFASVQLNLQQFDQALMIPTESVVPELGGKKVYRYQAGKATAVNVQTGIRQASMIQVTDGLSDGDTVITSGILQIRSGMDVDLTDLSGKAL